MPEMSDSPSSSRALVPLIALKPQRDEPHYGPVQRVASFITHLIATSEKLPQTRQKCRENCGRLEGLQEGDRGGLAGASGDEVSQHHLKHEYG